MKKIVWIASYPKSGNTWMRYLLGNYFFNHNDKFDPNIISYLKKFHLDDKLLNLNRLQDLKENPYNASKYWIKSQENLNILNGDITFLKTHNALININGNEFTNDDVTLAIIHIVRDPRDVVISYSKFNGLTIEQTINIMTKKTLYYTQDPKALSDISIIGSWGFNYESWKNGIPSIPRILIRYEDLITNCSNIFEKVIKFLSKHMNCKLNSRKIETSIELSKFENLKKYESKNTFKENVGFDNFFRVGKSNNWKKELSSYEAKIIEDKFNSEMIDLGYLT